MDSSSQEGKKKKALTEVKKLIVNYKLTKGSLNFSDNVCRFM